MGGNFDNGRGNATVLLLTLSVMPYSKVTAITHSVRMVTKAQVLTQGLRLSVHLVFRGHVSLTVLISRMLVIQQMVQLVRLLQVDLPKVCPVHVQAALHLLKMVKSSLGLTPVQTQHVITMHL